MQFKPWELEWGVKAAAALGFKMNAPTEDPRRSDAWAAAALDGLMDARVSEGSREDVQITLSAWRYSTAQQAESAIVTLSQSGLFDESVHRMLIGPTVFHLFQRGGDARLTKQLMGRVLDYEAVPQAEGGA
jgi:hypothetical protein